MGIYTGNGSGGASDFFVEVAKGNIQGHSLFAVVARNPIIGTTFEDAWGEGGVMVYPTANESWELVSDNTNDTSAGTGARTVLVSYLDDTFAEKTAVVIMDGTTPVAINADHFRPSSIIVLTAGSGETNIGKITLQVASAGNVRNVALAGVGRSHDTHFTVPTGMTGFVLTTSIIAPKDGPGIFQNRFRLSGADAAWVTGSVLPMYQNIIPFPFESKPPLPTGTDLQLQMKADTGTIDATVIFEIILIENEMTN